MKSLDRSRSRVSEVQLYLNELYGRVNSNMDHERMWGFMVEKAGNLSRVSTRAFRRQITAEDTEVHFVALFSWMFALANQFNRNVGTAFISKFPGVCPYCLEAPCVCVVTGRRPRQPLSVPEIKQDLAVRANIYLGFNSRQQVTFAFAMDMVRRIYPHNQHEFLRTPEAHFAKLLEEAAELRVAIRRFEEGKEKESALDDEFADLFAWSCSAWRLVRGSDGPDEDSLFSAFMKHYEHGCPRCITAPCKCVPGMDEASSTVGSSDVQKVLVTLRPLESRLQGDAAKQLQALELNLREALKEPMGFVLKNALRSADESLARISATALREEERAHVSDARAYLKRLILF